MKGIELAERFYIEYGAQMIHENFPQLEGLITTGIAGSGSECFGYDDVISTDHDFEPGFCLFIPDEDVIDSRTAFALERAYSKLPKEFMGFCRSSLNPAGGNRHGVIRISDFFRDKTGDPRGRFSNKEWFFVPEQSLAEAVNGRVFRDDLGYFTSVRERLAYMPEDVRLKKLVGELMVMGQSGQYNYSRCIARGENGAAQLAVGEFVNSAIHTVFLINKRYLPYYKWSFRAMRELPLLSQLTQPLEYLISSGNTVSEVNMKRQTIDGIASDISDELIRLELTDFSGYEMDGHARSVNDRISDGEIRNLHLMYAI